MYAMWPFRPTAIATPGAAASSIAVFTILSSLAGREVSSPELLRPICGSTYLIGVGTAAIRADGGGGAQAAAARSDKSRSRETDFMSRGVRVHNAGPAHRPDDLSRTIVRTPDNLFSYVT